MISRRAVPSESSAAVWGGLWVLGASGALIALTWLIGMIGPTPDIDTQTQKYVDQQLGFGVAWGLLYLVGLSLLMPGLVALTTLLYSARNRNLALGGLVLSVLSIGRLEAVVGVLSLDNAVAAQLYQDGNTNVLPVLHKFEGGHLAGLLNATFGAGALLSLLAAIAYGVAIWRSGQLPKWSAIVFALGLVLLASTAPFTSLPGSVLLAVASFAIARAVGRERAQATAGAAQMRTA